MSLRRYQKSLNRQQEMLLPSRVEDYVSDNNTVRAIDTYVDTLNLQSIGYTHTQEITIAGQPAYDPAGLLKLYLYGYIQGIRSSRKLEKEAHRNLEVIWLIEGQRPSYKTIANFRKNNSKALKSSNRDFVMLCKELNLLGGEVVAVDGSFFKADASKGSIYTESRLNKELDVLEKKITDYQNALDQQDEMDDKTGINSLTEDPQLTEKLENLKVRQADKQALKKRLDESGDKQISTVDQDARLLKKGVETIAGYNGQTVVDSLHHIIVAEELTQDGNDLNQLAPMLKKAQDVLESENLKGLADAGYYNTQQIKTCEEQNITPYVAIPKPPKTTKNPSRFNENYFVYNAEQNSYTCPQGNQLTARQNTVQSHGRTVIIYRTQTSDCKSCPLQTQCLTEKVRYKKMQRWEHQDIVDKHKDRMQKSPKAMRQRAALVEHPFGTLKHRAGMHHFLMRSLKKCSGEFSLMVLAYNFTRVLNTIDLSTFRGYCVQRQENGLQNSQYA